MKSIKLVLFLVLVVALAALVLQNQVPWLTEEVPGIILLFLIAAAGFIAGITVALPGEACRKTTTLKLKR